MCHPYIESAVALSDKYFKQCVFAQSIDCAFIQNTLHNLCICTINEFIDCAEQSIEGQDF